MPKNEEFNRNAENVDVNVNKNSMDTPGNEIGVKTKKTRAKKINTSEKGKTTAAKKSTKSVKVEKDSKTNADKASKASAKKQNEPKKLNAKSSGKDVKNTAKPKNTSNAKTSTKTTTKNASKNVASKNSNKVNNTSKKAVTSNSKKVENKKEVKVKEVKVEAKEEKALVEKPTEQTIIEKIKSFLAKIAAMQEEAWRESQDKKEAKTKAKKDAKEAKEAKKKAEIEAKKPEYLLEYYDLPYRYNETVVKILAQTPKKLFVYWDLSDEDRLKYVKTFGDDFFNKTYPVLLLYNEDKNYIREIAINDFANSWYINIDDPKTKYRIQLGRKFIQKPEFINFAELQLNNVILKTDYLPIADSNKLEVPNDHVLLETLPRFILFRNVKSGKEEVKDLGQIKNTLGRTYDIKEFYDVHYKDEVTDKIFDMSNPSSKMTSSMFK